MRRTILAVLCLVLAGCSSGGGGHRSAHGPYTDWPVYHHDGAHSGVVDGLPAAGRLGRAWTARLDGAVYGQPLVVGGRILAATENDTVYALAPMNGKVLWRRHLGTPVRRSDLPCGNIDPLGITSTPVYSGGLVFVLAEQTGFQFVLYGLSPDSGKVLLRREITPPDGHNRYQQQRAGLAAADGRVYVAFGGLWGDCGTYWGSVVGVPRSGALVSYRVPTTNRGAIWAPPGPVVDGRQLLVATGNAAATKAGDPWDGGDSVIALDFSLHQKDFFAPSSWAADNVSDADLGSMSPALLPGDRMVIAGKNGKAYLARTDRPGGIGGELASIPVCHGFGGAAVRDHIVYLPCVDGGIAAVKAGTSSLRILWRGPSDSNGPPVIGGGALWTVKWPQGRLYELNPGNGKERGHVDVGTVPHFASPALTGNLALIGTMHGITAVAGI